VGNIFKGIFFIKHLTHFGTVMVIKMKMLTMCYFYIKKHPLLSVEMNIYILLFESNIYHS